MKNQYLKQMYELYCDHTLYNNRNAEICDWSHKETCHHQNCQGDDCDKSHTYICSIDKFIETYKNEQSHIIFNEPHFIYCSYGKADGEDDYNKECDCWN